MFNELELFPNVENDDQADAISGGYMDLAKGMGGLVSQFYIPGYAEHIVQSGDLTLRGKQYVDK